MTIDKLFLFTAMIGGILFAAQLVLGLIGWGGGSADHVALHDASGADGADGGHDVSDSGFKVLSLQGLSAFLMMFGLVGLAMRRENGLGASVSLLGAVAAGTLATWLIGRMFRLFASLQSTGNLNMQKAVGAEGRVYLTIKRDKPGKVQLVVSGRMLTLDATTEEEQPLATGALVRVVRVTQENQIVVAGV
jgi:membrane protein implicated in regulation of membrane protease activity